MADPVTSPANSGDGAGASAKNPDGISPRKLAVPDPARSSTQVPDEISPSNKPIPNVEPFEIEPILLARVNRFARKHGIELSPVSVFIATACPVLLAICASALIDGAFLRPASKTSVIDDLWLFFTRSQSGPDSIRSMPYLRDYPALALTVTIILAVPLVYGIFRSMSTLHQDLEDNNCIIIDAGGDGRERLISAIDELNARLKNYGRRAKIVVPLIVLSLTFVNFRLKHQLYSYLEIDNLYDTWWARLFPFHLGGLVWITIGTLGVYMVYVEAMVGITYVRFLSRCSDNYRFGANRLNLDGFYGWSTLREAIYYQEAGAACAAISAFALFFIIQPAIGAVPTAVVLGFFILVVLYVFFSAIRHLRRQVSDDRKKQIKEVLEKLSTEEKSDGVAGQVATLVAYRHLQAIEKIPAMPIRQRSLVTGIAPIIAALIGLVSQLIKYLS